MQLTNPQKIYAAVLGLALSAFAFDRWVLGPGDADALDDVAVSPAGRPAHRRPVVRTAAPRDVAPLAAATPAAPAAAPQVAPTSSAGTLAARLQAVARRANPAGETLAADAVGDAFRPSVAWVGAARQAAPTAELTDAAKDFQNNHKLMAVLKQSGGGVAIIDKTTVAVGQSVDGFRLVAVKDRSAVLRRGAQRLELQIEDKPQGGGTASVAPTSEKLAATDPMN